MQGLDIRLSVGWRDHPKTRRLHRLHGDAGLLALLQLWLEARKHRPDGKFSGWNDEDVADASSWRGDAGEWIATLVELRWLDRESDGTLAIHDWEEHNSWAAGANRRSEAARTANRARWSKVREESGSDPTGVRPESDRNRPTPTPAPTPAPDPNPENTARSRADSFEEFWAAYPKPRGSRKQAREQWERNGLSDLARTIIESVRSWTAFRKKHPEQFVANLPHAFRYLRDQRWTDDPPQAERETVAPIYRNGVETDDSMTVRWLQGILREWGFQDMAPHVVIEDATFFRKNQGSGVNIYRDGVPRLAEHIRQRVGAPLQ